MPHPSTNTAALVLQSALAQAFESGKFELMAFQFQFILKIIY
jgi:hypothetical protein